MNLLPRYFCVVACACSLTSCQTATRLIQAPLQVGQRMLQAIGRTAGMTSEARTEPASEDAIAARGKMIQDQGTYGAPGTSPASDNVAKR